MAEIPKDVEERINRGRAKMRSGAAKRRLFYKFWRGDTYWSVNSKGLLSQQDTVSWRAGGKMPDHRIRNSYPFISSIVQAKVSAATQRVPGYEVLPSTAEPEDAQAAALAEKVALYGYDEWRVRRATVKTVEHALVGGEGFAYPFFDNSLGPFTETEKTDEYGEPEVDELGDPQVEHIGQGDIRVLILSANEVYWEPGTEFDESRWYVIEQAVPKDVLEDTPGFIKSDEDLVPDATDSEAPVDKNPDLVLRKEYLERPSPKHTKGRRLVMAGGRLILPEEPYPCVDPKGNVLDEPVLLRLSYIAEVDDRDRGLVELLVDLQRTIQDTWSKILEFKNRGLNLQMTAPRGSNMARRDDTPGAMWYYTPVGGQKPEWEPSPDSRILSALFQVLDKAIEHMRAIAADIDVQADPDVAARTAQAAIEESRMRWQHFLGDLAEFHSRLMRRCLYLVQRHYTEPRLIKVMGLFGTDLTPGFMGADLNGQADIRVSPESLAVKSRKQVVEETLLYADRQWISPQSAMRAISGGNVEVLDNGKNDRGRANHVIQLIKQGPQELFKAFAPRSPGPGEQVLPDSTNPYMRALMFEQLWRGSEDQGPLNAQEIPGWVPRPFDNVDIHREVFETWMKTAEWERLQPDMREAASLYYEILLALQQQRAMEAAMRQEQQAQALGMESASTPQRASPTPDQRLPALNGEQ